MTVSTAHHADPLRACSAIVEPFRDGSWLATKEHRGTAKAKKQKTITNRNRTHDQRHNKRTVECLNHSTIINDKSNAHKTIIIKRTQLRTRISNRKRVPTSSSTQIDTCVRGNHQFTLVIYFNRSTDSVVILVSKGNRMMIIVQRIGNHRRWECP